MCCNKKIPFNITEQVNTEAGVTKYPIDTWKKLQDSHQNVIGAFVRKQNDAGTRYGKSGKKLLNNVSLDNAYLQLLVKNTQALHDYPLSNLIHEGGVNAPGDYAKLIFPEGVSISGSHIVINDGTNVVDNETIEIVFITESLC